MPDDPPRPPDAAPPGVPDPMAIFVSIDGLTRDFVVGDVWTEGRVSLNICGRDEGRDSRAAIIIAGVDRDGRTIVDLLMPTDAVGRLLSAESDLAAAKARIGELEQEGARRERERITGILKRFRAEHRADRDEADGEGEGEMATYHAVTAAAFGDIISVIASLGPLPPPGPAAGLGRGDGPEGGDHAG